MQNKAETRMDSSNIVTLIFLVAAVFVFMQLRNVLGQRTGHERPPEEMPDRRRPKMDDDIGADNDGDNVITLPGRGEAQANKYREIDRLTKSGSTINKGLRAIKDAVPQFDAREFLDGGRMAYEMIVMAFADGDRKTLQSLLSKEVYDGFASALDEREKAGESVRTNFVGIEQMNYEAAELRDNEAHITVNVVSQLVTSTVDNDGNVVDGDAEAVVEVKDVWTFARDIRDRDPNWKLVATEAED